MQAMNLQSSPNGLSYLREGFRLIFLPGIRLFVFIPLVVNVILMSMAIYYAMSFIPELNAWITGYVGESIGAVIGFLIWPLAIVLAFFVTSYTFVIFSNWIAAPFNGLLAEAVERHLRMANGCPGPDSEPLKLHQAIQSAVSDLPRVLGRELKKLLYFIPRAIFFLAAFFLLPVFGQILWFLFSGWMMAVQYVDYPMDNHKRGFSETTRGLKRRKWLSFGFGCSIMGLTLVPIINLFIMPAAVAGGTAYWFDHFREDGPVEGIPR